MSRALRFAVNNTLPPPEPFPFNAEALETLEKAYQAYKTARSIESISCTAVGAPGSDEKLQRVAELFTEAVALIQEVAGNSEEKKRYEHWTDLYDNPDRPETFNKSPF